jgi:single-strand DNA-binding protein
MGSLNRVTLIGNLGADADLRYTPGGHAIARFSIATTDTWKDKNGQKQERTEWHRINLWGNVAEALREYLTKGKQVCVEGSLQTQKWTDKNGVERYTTSVRADRVVLLGGGPRRQDSNHGDAYEGESASEPTQGEPLSDDQIPF